ncbi:hypothetical protein PR048_008426 [Dryococelus australis]|uniref:Uncharacterized protein n=1 Tax=Dryococelus australis TaxID=614101 RepID=A0ABQ9HX38_9NEOP|nr:hypothetical protein PR048_008426 [Dryococelus australis]
MEWRGKREIPEANGTIPTCEIPVTRPGIELGSPWWQANRLTSQPPWPLTLLASHLGEPGSIPGRITPGFSQVGIVPDDAAFRRVFSGISFFPPPFYSGATPYSPLFTLESQDLDVKSRPNLFNHLRFTKNSVPWSFPVQIDALNPPRHKGRKERGWLDESLHFVLEVQNRMLVTYEGGKGSHRFSGRQRPRGAHTCRPAGPPSGFEVWSSSNTPPLQRRTSCFIWLLPISGPRVAERLACSPPTKANRVQYPAWSLPDFRMWVSCRTIPLVGGFSWGSPVSPALSFRRRSILTSITLIVSEDLAVKTDQAPLSWIFYLRLLHANSRPNLFTPSDLGSLAPYAWRFSFALQAAVSLESYRPRPETDTAIMAAIACASVSIRD